MPQDPTLKCIQLHIHLREVAIDVCCEVPVRKGAHVLFVSEPNKSAVAGRKWVKDSAFDAAIVLAGPGMAVLGSGRGTGYAWLELSQVVAVSVYSSPNLQMRYTLNKIEELAKFTRRWHKPMVIDRDFNDRMRLWGETCDSARGKVLVEAMFC